MSKRPARSRILGVALALTFASGCELPGFRKNEDATLAFYAKSSVELIAVFDAQIRPLLARSNCTHCHSGIAPTITAAQSAAARTAALPFLWDPLESTCRHASLSIL